MERSSYLLDVDFWSDSDHAGDFGLPLPPCAGVPRPRCGAKPRLPDSLVGVLIALQRCLPMMLARCFSRVATGLQNRSSKLGESWIGPKIASSFCLRSSVSLPPFWIGSKASKGIA